MAEKNSETVEKLDLTAEDLQRINSAQGIKRILKEKNHDIEKLMFSLNYEHELKQLQIELVKLQRDVHMNNRRLAIIFEGRDAAGKGGNIRRFIEHLNPRAMRVVALSKPTEVEKGQWYFQRYVNTLPNPGEITFYDRSWYNRAVVEPVMGFCTEDEYRTFLLQVPEFEHMLYEDGVEIIKFWLSISKTEQKSRFDSRKGDPLKQWKLSPIDEKAQEHWDDYTKYKKEMFSRTHMSYSPWIIIEANNKKRARLETIRYVLNHLNYEGKDQANISLDPDPEVASRFHRSAASSD
ncbi:polyphosphate kinase 2 [Ekhidna sp. To15]|uniref:polyphosphate kinase 2 n=1 Tax=Ekhidna sp. To15 TaxID=3395267 RepID=UPI003F520367